jgi:uncharacterized protein (DUF2147 family)
MTAAAAEPAGTLSPDPTGEWLVAKAVARIRIADCQGRLWGVVAWEARPGIDSKNPDPNLRNRPTLGMPILLGMVRNQPNQWDGEIYNAEDGRTYSANISLENPDTLRVRGCILGFLCGGENWTRVQPSSPPGAPSQSRSRTARPASPAANQTDDVCLQLFGPARLPH